MKYIFFLASLLLTVNTVQAQDDDDDLILGKSKKEINAAVYDLSDPTGVNIEVNMWGFVRYPGRYRVPLKTRFMDLMTYAGGPIENSDLQEIRILRNTGNPDAKPELIKLNYNDLMWEENISSKPKQNPELKPGDVIIVKEQRRYTFRDDLGVILPIVTTLVSVATLIVTITLYK
jgi:protein involved in polysaccharide export with SLBB domain